MIGAHKSAGVHFRSMIESTPEMEKETAVLGAIHAMPCSMRIGVPKG